ncbi:MAG: hypothetical protein M3R68_01230 [Acidobacteriota bacterium]|nr:hypothetical protein [Acidobacteriota bacterium]
MGIGTDWTKEADVLAELERLNGRPPSPGEKELVIGQRQINRRFFDAINAILDVVSPSPSKDSAEAAEASSAERLAAIKKELQKVPGERIPGCTE